MFYPKSLLTQRHTFVSFMLLGHLLYLFLLSTTSFVPTLDSLSVWCVLLRFLCNRRQTVCYGGTFSYYGAKMLFGSPTQLGTSSLNIPTNIQCILIYLRVCLWCSLCLVVVVFIYESVWAADSHFVIQVKFKVYLSIELNMPPNKIYFSHLNIMTKKLIHMIERKREREW